MTIGITDHAQAALGDLVFVELPDGRAARVAAGEACAVVESVKAASDVYAPVAGEVVAVNDALAGAPEAVNEDAYARVAVPAASRPMPARCRRLLDAAAYERR